MEYYLVGLFCLLVAGLMFWVGRAFYKIPSIKDLIDQMNPLLKMRAVIIYKIMGEKWGTLWIRFMGVLCILTALVLVGMAIGVVIFQPEKMFG